MVLITASFMLPPLERPSKRCSGHVLCGYNVNQFYCYFSASVQYERIQSNNKLNYVVRKFLSSSHLFLCVVILILPVVTSDRGLVLPSMCHIVIFQPVTV